MSARSWTPLAAAARTRRRLAALRKRVDAVFSMIISDWEGEDECIVAEALSGRYETLEAIDPLDQDIAELQQEWRRDQA